MKFKEPLDVSVLDVSADEFVNKDVPILTGMVAGGITPRVVCPVCSKGNEYLVGLSPENSENGYVIWSLASKKILEDLLGKGSINKLNKKTCYKCNEELEVYKIIYHTRE